MSLDLSIIQGIHLSGRCLSCHRMWLRNRRCINKTFISIVLCTDDEAIDEIYRYLEYNPGMNQGIQVRWKNSSPSLLTRWLASHVRSTYEQGVDFTEDYRGEMRDIRRTRGSRYPFSFGDYVVKTLVGSIDPSIHLIDLPQGGCCAVS